MIMHVAYHEAWALLASPSSTQTANKSACVSLLGEVSTTSVNVFASNLEVLAYYAGSKSHMAKASQLICQLNVFLLICF
jgi:hypothetical protein